MDIEITKMQLSDFEQIEDNLQENFDDFWTPQTLKQELENKNRFKFLLHSSKARTRSCRICGNCKHHRRS